jgi:hypothetical protein
MALAEDIAENFEIIVHEDGPTFATSKATWVVLLPLWRCAGAAWQCAGGLCILTLDTAVAAVADGSVLLVIVALAVRLVIDDIEVSSRKRFVTRSTDKASFVPATREASIRGLDRLSLYG